MDPLDAPTFDPEKTRRPPALLPENLFGAFGKYDIVQKIGQGGMGAVYLAEDTTLGRRVALKVPLFSLADREIVLGRFGIEARSAASLRHPYICPIFEYGELHGLPFMVSPFLSGKTLQDHLDAEPFWSVARSLEVTIKVADALHYAHGHRVVHRDIKPSNIMIEESGEPLVLDFGLARCDDSISKQWTSTTEVIGTPSYMAPEQIDHKLGSIGPACDIYALGVTLYRMVLGRLPFTGEPLFVIPQILADPPPLPSRTAPQLENVERLDAVILRALAKKPSDRFESMAEFQSELQSALAKAVPSRLEKCRLPDLRIVETQQRYRPSALQHRIRIGRQRVNPKNPNELMNDLVIRAGQDDAKSLRISRQHCEIIIENSQIGVVDKSQAGLQINGRAARKGEFEPLNVGDKLNIAGVVELELIESSHARQIPSERRASPSGSLFEATMGDLYIEASP